MPTTLNNGIQLPDKGSVDWYSSMQSNYNLIDTHLGNTDIHVTAEDKANWDSKQGSLSQAQLDAIAQVDINTNDIATLQSGKANASHTHSSSDITDIGDYATKQYVDTSISDLVDNAPDALNTLNELSAALNDDSNFASTVTTALGAKANSADLATVATSGSYTDLTDKPTINDSTITIQKNGSTVDTFTTNGSAKTINITVPTKTSDLTNDSNFVDTSNSAVASGITSAKVTDYDTHIADTDKHVTTADKNRWNNQTYVLRYSSTTLVASSTNSNSLLDNTDNLKVGDKVIDASGVIYSVTAIDTANSTFTIGTSLIDLAQDTDVVHKSGNETIGGVKTFTDNLNFKSNSAELGVTGGYTDITFLDKNDKKLSRLTLGNYASSKLSYARLSIFGKDTNGNEVQDTLDYAYVLNNSNAYLRVSRDNFCSLGGTSTRWKAVYATNYYYGSNNVEFSTKFVTTDTAQTVTGTKTFSSTVNVYNSDNTANTPNLILKNEKQDRSTPPSSYEAQYFYFTDKNNNILSYIQSGVTPSNVTQLVFRCYDKNGSNDGFSIRKSTLGTYIQPSTDNAVSLGASSAKWSDVQTNKINGLTPSSLSMPDIDNRVDISSYITDLTGVNNEYTPTVNGWICVRSPNATKISILDSATSIGNQSVSSTATYLTVMTPVVANRKVYLNVVCTSLSHAYFIPCQGNV